MEKSYSPPFLPLQLQVSLVVWDSQEWMLQLN